MWSLRQTLRRFPTAFAVLLVAALVHGFFAWSNRERRPDMVVLEKPPGATARAILSFGDSQFLYRFWSSHLQNAGDTGGRATRMGDYNYDYVIGWLEALQALDGNAQQHPFLAAHYFSQTPNRSDVRRVVEFIVSDAVLSPERKWYWLTFAMTLAQKRLNDLPYALEISRRLASYDFPDMSGWNYVFPAIFLERMGRYGEAREEIARLLAEKNHRLAPEQRLWTEEFTHGLAAQE